MDEVLKMQNEKLYKAELILYLIVHSYFENAHTHLMFFVQVLMRKLWTFE